LVALQGHNLDRAANARARRKIAAAFTATSSDGGELDRTATGVVVLGLRKRAR
jgi:hypothetical protein